MEKHEVINALLSNGYWLDNASEYGTLTFKRQTNNCVSMASVYDDNVIQIDRFLVDEDGNRKTNVTQFNAYFNELYINGKACMNLENYTSIVL